MEPKPAVMREEGENGYGGGGEGEGGIGSVRKEKDVNLPEFLRAEGNAAFRSGRNEDAVRLYTLAIEKLLLSSVATTTVVASTGAATGTTTATTGTGGRVNVLLCNRAIAHFRSGAFAKALDDAKESYAQSTDTQERAKAKYWEAKSYVALHREPEAIDALRIGLRVLPRDRKLTQELEERVHALSAAQIGKLWTSIIDHASKAAAMSSRDGKFLKPVPSSDALDSALLGQTLTSIFETGWELRQVWDRDGESPSTCGASGLGQRGSGAASAPDVIIRHEAAAMLCASWARGKDFPPKESMALFRALAYLKRGKCKQGMQDANVAVAYASDPGWPRALAVRALAHECAANARVAGSDARVRSDKEHSLAALEVARAIELLDTSTASTYQSAHVDRACVKEEFEALMLRILPKVPDAHRTALSKGGAKGLQEWLDNEHEQSKPEYLRKRPKYYYYYEWMRRRIEEHCPALPEPVVDKLLTMDSNELDLLLQHEKAIKGQAQDFLEVFERDGALALETYMPTSLTWEEVKALKGPGTIGLGHGAEAAPGAGFLEAEKDTDHALIGGRGEAGMLTEAEKQIPSRDAPIAVPMLPPDQSRDTSHIAASIAKQKDFAKLLTDSQEELPGADATRDALRNLNVRQRKILMDAEKAIAASNPECIDVNHLHSMQDCEEEE